MYIANHTRNGQEQRASLQVLCDSAQQVDCFVSFRDQDVTITDKGTNANHYAVSSTAPQAVTLLGPAPKNNYKVVEYASFRALISNSVSVTVRVQLYDNVNSLTYDLYSALLQPGETLVYHQHVGWIKTTVSGNPPAFADLVTQFISELRTQFSSLGPSGSDLLV